MGDVPPNAQLEKPKWRYCRAILVAHGLSVRTAIASLVDRVRLLGSKPNQRTIQTATRPTANTQSKTAQKGTYQAGIAVAM